MHSFKFSKIDDVTGGAVAAASEQLQAEEKSTNSVVSSRTEVFEKINKSLRQCKTRSWSRACVWNRSNTQSIKDHVSCSKVGTPWRLSHAAADTGLKGWGGEVGFRRRGGEVIPFPPPLTQTPNQFEVWEGGVDGGSCPPPQTTSLGFGFAPPRSQLKKKKQKR